MKNQDATSRELNNLTINLTKLSSFSSAGIASITHFTNFSKLFTIMSNQQYLFCIMVNEINN